MKHLFLITILFITLNLYSQNQIIGKTYKSQVSASCKEFDNGGGCMSYTYCTLHFLKQIVWVSYQYESLCSVQSEDSSNKTNEKLKTKYFYKIKNNIISTKGFDTYGKLTLVGKKLIGKKEINYKEYINLEFEQQ